MMNSPMNLFNPQIMQLLKSGGNPQQMLMGMLQKNAGNNPMANNVLNMMNKGDQKGIETFCRNILSSKGYNPDEVMEQMKNQFK